MSEVYGGFREIKAEAYAQKEAVLNGDQGGYEPHLHRLFTVVCEKFKAKYGNPNGRDAVFLLAFLHANKLGETAPLTYPVELRGWAFPKDVDIIEKTGISKARLPVLKRILREERYVIIKKRTYRRSVKDYYLPFYWPHNLPLEYNDL